MAERPEISVVVVPLAGPGGLGRCLSALARQTGSPSPEVVVPYDDALAGGSGLDDRFPAARFVHVPGRQSYAALRSRGMREARGRVVAVTEDHCAPDSDWCSRLLAHHAEGHDVVGGRVERERAAGGRTSSRLDWAVYLTDFHRYMRPVEPGPADYLTDCNVSYRREALDEIAGLWEEEFHETTVNWTLDEAGRSLYLADDVVVRQFRHLTAGYVLRERFSFGRLFASTRARKVGGPQRLLYAGACWILPGLLTARVLGAAFRKRRHVARALGCLPQLALINTVWAVGEFVGYCTGRSGTLPVPPGFGGGAGEPPERAPPTDAPGEDASVDAGRRV